MKKHVIALTAALILSASASAAHASEPKLLGTYGDWSAYRFTENGNKVCYMASKPKKAEGNYTRRGEIFALITHRPSESTKNVFSYITGYTYKAGSDVSLSIGSKKFSLFTQGETAWATDAKTDNTIAEAVKNGNTMIIRGTSSRGTKTKDTFSLKGSTAAHNKITSACK